MKYGSPEHRTWQQEMINKYGMTGEFDVMFLMERAKRLNIKPFNYANSYDARILCGVH